jgi:hypothetical protein
MTGTGGSQRWRSKTSVNRDESSSQTSRSLLVLVRDWHHSIFALVRALSSMQLRQPDTLGLALCSASSEPLLP